VRKITAQEQEAGFRLNLGEYFRVIWRKKYFLVVPLVISVAVASVGARFLVPEYESSAVIRIGTAAGADSEVDRFVQPGIGRKTRDAEIAAQLEAEVLGSAFLDELILQLGMDQDPDLIAAADLQRENLYAGVSTEELVLRRLRNFLKSRIKIEIVGAGLFRIAYADANPEACYVLTEAMTRLYIDRQRRQAMRGLQEVSDFSADQLSVHKERLDRSERDLANFQEQMAQRSTTTNPVFASNIAQAERLRNDLSLSINSSESTLDRIKQRLVSLIGAVPDGERIWRDPELRKLVNDLTTRRESEILSEVGSGGMSTLGGADGITITQQATQRRLSVLVAERFAQVPADYQPLMVEYFFQQAEIDALRAKRGRLDSYIGAFRSQVTLAPQVETELTRLRQEVERNREYYNTFKNAQTRTEISTDAQNSELGATVFLVEAATRPLAPVRPDRVKILVLALMFGIALGASGLVLTEFTDSSFRSVDEVEKQLGLKVLGTIPRFERTRWFHDSSRRRAVLWVAISSVFLGVALAGFYFYGKSTREGLIDLNFSQSGSVDPATGP